MSISLIGLKVNHPVFGEGTVINSRWGGSEVLVDFGHLKLWLKKQVVIFSEPQPSIEVMEIAEESISTEEKRFLRLRQVLEALRLGVVPFDYVEKFTFGRDKEIAIANAQLKELEENGGSALLIEGSYGVGKTHFLDYLFMLALRQKFLVTKVELSTRGVAPNRPKHVYRELLKSLTYINRKGEIRGFRDFILEVLEKHSSILESHRYLKEVIWYTQSGVSDYFWNWLEREYSSQRPLLYDFSTASNIYTYILTGIGYAAREIGYKGLVIILDEGERLWNLDYQYQIDSGTSFLKGLVYTGLGKDTSSLPRVAWASEIPYLFRNPSSLMIVLSFTSIPYFLNSVVSWNSQISINNLLQEDLRKVFNHIIEIYSETFPGFPILIQMKEVLFSILSNKLSRNIRRFIKGTIEFLDISRFQSDLNIEDLQWNI